MDLPLLHLAAWKYVLACSPLGPEMGLLVVGGDIILPGAVILPGECHVAILGPASPGTISGHEVLPVASNV